MDRQEEAPKVPTQYLNIQVAPEHLAAGVGEIAHKQLAGALVYNLQNLGACGANVWQVQGEDLERVGDILEVEIPPLPPSPVGGEEHAKFLRHSQAQDVGFAMISRMPFIEAVVEGKTYQTIVLAYDPIFPPDAQALVEKEDAAAGGADAPPGVPLAG